MATYNVVIDLVEGVFCIRIDRYPACLNGDYLAPFAYPILLDNGNPLTPAAVLKMKMNPSDNNKYFNSGHRNLMSIPEEILEKAKRSFDFKEGVILSSPPYDFSVAWNYQCDSLSVYAPYQILISQLGEMNLIESLKLLKNPETKAKIEKERRKWRIE